MGTRSTGRKNGLLAPRRRSRLITTRPATRLARGQCNRAQAAVVVTPQRKSPSRAGARGTR